ncbi:MAG: hypothetical protein RI894_1879 [Bacteroidota bacterium]|jgi:opacity protein-like surface antigen
MKKTATLLATTALIVSSMFTAAVAQPYIQIKSGYSLGIIPTILDRTVQTGFPTASATSPTTNRSLANIYGTYGSGLNFGLDFGYMVSEHFGFNLNGTYFIGNPINGNTTSLKNDTLTRSYNTVYNATQLRITPSFILLAGNQHGFNPYARFGVILPFINYTDEKFTGSDKYVKVESGAGLTTRSYETQYTNRVTYKFDVGFTGAVGTTYALNENIAVVGEIEFNTLNSRADKASYIAYNQDYKRQPTTGNPYSTNTDLNKLNTYTKEILYLDQIDQNANSAYSEISPNKVVDKNRPQEVLTKINSFTAVGINIGLRYNLQTANRSE